MSSIVSSPFPTTLVQGSSERPADDPIFRLNAEARARAAAGESIVNATLGALMTDEGKIAIPPAVAQAFAAVPIEKSAGYAPIAGSKPFLEAVIQDLFGEGPLASAAVAAATPGGTGALHHAFVNFLDPGQAVYVPSYYWGPYHTLAVHTRRTLETFEMFDDAGRFNLKAFEEGLDALLSRQGRALCVLNFPCNNPTGYSLDAAEWERLTEIVSARATKHPVVLVIDYAYAKFARHDAGVWVRYAEQLARVTTVLVAWTVSKSFAQYGARVGALVAAHMDAGERQRIQNALSYSCRGTWSNCNHAGQLAITELLTDPELRARVLLERQEMVELLSQRVDAFNAAAAKVGLSFPRYEGGFFVAVFTPDGEATAKHMRDHAGVYVVPLQGAVRVALCSTPLADIERTVAALAAGVEAARGA